jgi:hypothetical protein
MVRFMLILSTLLLAGPAIAHGGGGHHGGGYYVQTRMSVALRDLAPVALSTLRSKFPREGSVLRERLIASPD